MNRNNLLRIATAVVALVALIFVGRELGAYVPRFATWVEGLGVWGPVAFMAGYGIQSFLIAQSLNQIEKAYGPNNAILDNCHVRVSFATND